MPINTDFFGSDSFSAVALTGAINSVKPINARITQDGLFTDEGIATTKVMLDFEDEEVNLVPQSNRGTDRTKSRRSSKSSRYIDVPMRGLEDAIKASDIQNNRIPGATDLETAESLAAKIMLRDARKLMATKEYLRAGALAGLIVDPDGTTIEDLWTGFGVTQTVIDMNLDSATTDVSAKSIQAKDAVDEALAGSLSTGYRAYCDTGFFQALVSHAKVREAYAFYLGTNPTRDEVREGFVFDGVEYVRYRGAANKVNDAGVKTNTSFIAANTAILVPTGTTDIFKGFDAPADHLEFANTIGQPMYAWSDYQRGKGVLDIYSEADYLPLVTKPKVLVKLTLT